MRPAVARREPPEHRRDRRALALPKTTIFGWVREIPLDRERRWSDGQRKGCEAMQAKYRRLRENAYAEGQVEFDALALCCEHGVASVQAYDTLVRARPQAWMDRLRDGWTLESAEAFGA